MQSVSYYVPNISCKHCTQRIISHLTELPGVLDVDANVESKEVFVDF
jgi:copper chaperone CopZ